jgi:mono/diheme cytochrome c family protein
MKTYVVVAALVLLCGFSTARAEQAGARSTSAGVFTAEQAKNGERAYQAQCASCHGTDLNSTDTEAPDLTDSSFKKSWQGKTIANRFEKIRTTMPPGASRTLDDQTYLDVVSYILQFNGIPSGNEKLLPDVAVLGQIVIAIP